jgi:hypothetical protein
MASHVLHGRPLAVMVLVAALGACGDDGAPGGGGGGGDGSGSGGDDACDSGFAPCDSGSGGQGGGGSDAGACGLEPLDAALCGEALELACGEVGAGAVYELCSVALGEPPSGAGADASCFEPGSYPEPPAATATTRMEGYVRIFANGCQSSDVTVEVYTVDDDGELGARIGTSATTPSSCVENGEPTNAEDCGDGVRYECAYVYPNVPTETLLAVRTSGPNWTPVIDYAVFIRNEAAESGAFTYDPHVVASDDYGVIAQAAQGRPVSPGKGVILGEVRDCSGSPVPGAIAGTAPAPIALTYLTNDEENPLPDLNATSTGTYGRFAAIEVDAGPARVVAAAEVGGSVTSLGTRDVRVFPDAITWVDLSRPLPTQVPTD